MLSQQVQYDNDNSAPYSKDDAKGGVSECVRQRQAAIQNRIDLRATALQSVKLPGTSIVICRCGVDFPTCRRKCGK